MSNKAPNGIVLPEKGMEEATKAAQTQLASKQGKVKSVTSNEVKDKPAKTSQKAKAEVPSSDDLQALQSGIAKYTGIEEHGMSVWAVKAVKKRLDELKYRTGGKVGYRAFTNAALEFVLDRYADELIAIFEEK